MRDLLLRLRRDFPVAELLEDPVAELLEDVD
jgi:hypothetical protein